MRYQQVNVSKNESEWKNNPCLQTTSDRSQSCNMVKQTTQSLLLLSFPQTQRSLWREPFSLCPSQLLLTICLCLTPNGAIERETILSPAQYLSWEAAGELQAKAVVCWACSKFKAQLHRSSTHGCQWELWCLLCMHTAGACPALMSNNWGFYTQ